MYKKLDDSVKTADDYLARLDFYYEESMSFMQDLYELDTELAVGMSYATIAAPEKWYTDKDLMLYSVLGIEAFDIGVDSTSRNEYNHLIRKGNSILFKLF